MTVIYLDVETTGIDPSIHAVIQVAWMVEVDGDVASENVMATLSRRFIGAALT